MAAPKKSRKSSGPKNQYTAELSSSQLVLGITILMVFGLACFLLGVLIGKFDPSLRGDDLLAATPTETQQVTDASRSNAGAGANNSKPTVSKTTPKSTPPAPEAKSVETKRVVVSAKPATKPARPSHTTKPVATKPATTVPKSSSVSVSDIPPVETASNTKPVVASLKKPEVRAPASAPKSTTERAGNPTPPASPTPPVQTSAGEIWAIQIGAFKDATLAVVERKRLESKLPYKIDILRRPGEVWNRLVVGRHTSKDRAIILKQELITQHKLDAPFLVKRN